MSDRPRSVAPWSQQPLDDNEVVKRVLAGENCLFELLIRRHNQRLFRVARSILDDDNAAEEALQQTYIKIWTRLETFAGRSSLVTWMHRILVRICYGIRQGQRSADREPIADGDDEPVCLEQPFTTAAGSETAREVEEAMMSLTPGYRAVFTLRVIEGMSTAAVAEALEVSEGVVKVRLHRARERLQRRLVAHAESSSGRRDIWRFDGARCDRITAAVLDAIARVGG